MVRPSKPRPKLQFIDQVKLLRVCGLCGEATKELTRTECCDNAICDDLSEYVTFSYARNSCFRNHANQTLCAFHHHNAHAGGWKECSKCRAEFEPEMYAWYATNPFNFEKLKDPPPFGPTLCDGCGKRIVLPRGGYSLANGKRWCERCDPEMPPRRRTRPQRRGV